MHDDRRHEHGFTLIELLTVVVIVGILAAIAMPRLMGQRDRAAASAAVAALRGVVNVVPDLSEGATGFPAEGTVITAATETLRSYAFVDAATPVGDARTVSVSTAADSSHVVFATASVTGDCFFLRVHDDGRMDRHRVDELVGCRAEVLDAATAGSGW